MISVGIDVSKYRSNISIRQILVFRIDVLIDI